ncbi:hypothetical protein ABZ883_22220 [Streptomyces sp. NPDC046977]|uniref:hypothetical protein n=1 Tax=Streptomyces sp. NPDC046977 TaxID=3154703 RepID=UPI0033E84984
MRRWIAAFVAALSVAGNAACTATTAHPEPKASATVAVAGPRACVNGTYQWFNVEQPLRLSALSGVLTLGKGGGEFKDPAPIHRVSWPVTSVSASGPALPSRDVLLSLATWIGEAEAGDDPNSYAFTDVSRKSEDPNKSRAISSESAGRFVEYGETQIVEADFRYACPSSKAVTIGHAKSWTIEGGGLIECGTPIHGTREWARTHLAVAREAARLSCGPKSVAAQADSATGY